MKLQLKVGKKLKKRPKPHHLAPKVKEDNDQVVIDISQVLAASQALLKNLALKIESLESRLESIEIGTKRTQRLLRSGISQRRLLLEAPKEVKPWEPDHPELNEGYFGNFSFFDRIFRPERLRRTGAEN